ncbi:MAG TPA: ATP-binding protein [Stellaceae bacterium]|nr:ATP-binding protein [Stellaceae bacterium]
MERQEQPARQWSKPRHQIVAPDPFFDLSVDLLCVAAVGGKLLRVNSAFRRLLGFDETSVSALTLKDLLHPKDRRALARVTDGMRDRHIFVGTELRLRDAHGQWRWIEWSCRAQGGLFYAVGRDVTDRKRQESLADAQQRLLTAVVENLPLANTLDLVCRSVEDLVEGALCSVLLMSADGRRLLKGAAPNLPPDYSVAIDGAEIGEGAGSCGTAAFRRAIVIVEDIAIDPLWVDYRSLALAHGLRSCWSTPIISPEGVVLGTFAQYRRVPSLPSAHELQVIDRLSASCAIAIQRKSVHDELVAAKKRAEAASHAKSEFLANMSHELRTPLNAVIGFSELIESQFRGPIGEPIYLDYVRDIRLSGMHLLGVINSVLDVARIEAGKTQLDYDEVTVEAAIGEKIRLVEHAFPGRSPMIEVVVPPDCPMLHVDRRAFDQVLFNIVGNAVKFTPDGGRITVRVDAGAPGLKIRIEDTGVGIPSDRIADLCQPFKQIDGVYNRRHPGSGLGLYISRALIEGHGGRIDIASVVNIGSTVTISFPEDRVMRGGTSRWSPATAVPTA